ncbi:MAG TPA: energy transducer TonB [Pyrinomonadaceae bacterium]|nr:energy transducer TonB [Pyrinomonadaceae bacterium]
MSSIEPGENFISEDELKNLLDRWIAPEPSKELDQRVANSYYKEFSGADAALNSVLLPLSQKEVRAMKFCSTCREEFADKFSFCPVDGTPLTAPVVEPEQKVVSAGPRASFSERMPTPALAGSAAAAGLQRGEFHLTMMDDAGLVGRLAKELSDVAHEYQLTWPEFKRDPFGFTKRTFVGYGQMAGKFFANRYVMIGLGVALLAMVGLVGVVRVLDRSQSGGISKTGFVGFGLVAAVILATIFITWLKKSQSGAVLGAPNADSNNALAGMIAAFSVFLLLIGGGVLFNSWQKRVEAQNQRASDELVVDQIFDIPNEQPTPDEGTAGLNKGNGGGSKPKQEKPGGGGGGGREEQKPASFGKTPQASLTVPQVVAPDPHPPAIKNPSLPVAATVVADPLLVPPDARVLPYGDFKSKSTDPSSGPGTGNGIGTGRGGGIGPGEGGGIGPGRGGNIGGGDYHEGGGGPGGPGGGYDPSRIYGGKDVTSKARVLSKPEPQYTEEARKNQITGTVVLRAVFTSGGQVTNITARQGLPFGLTERAIAAARQIKFVPATKDGHPVSMYIQLEYNFNLY